MQLVGRACVALAGILGAASAVGCGGSSAGAIDAGGPEKDVSTAIPDGNAGTDGATTPDAGAIDSTAPPTDAGTTDGTAPPKDAGTDGSAPPKDASPPEDAGEAGTKQVLEATFYGWDDNSPPGNAISYPTGGKYPTIHTGAGGTGTYADPITFATDPTELVPGTLVYAPFIEKYLIMEDSCGQCETDWQSKKWHIDIWMNSNGTENANDLYTCEDNWTQSSTTVEIHPPPGRTVTTTPLFDPSTNVCRTTP